MGPAAPAQVRDKAGGRVREPEQLSIQVQESDPSVG